MNKQDTSSDFKNWIMTYGWAILGAVIAIGVFAYFGVFSPGSYTSPVQTFCNSNYLIYDSNFPESCIFLQNDTAYMIDVINLNNTYYFKRMVP